MKAFIYFYSEIYMNRCYDYHDMGFPYPYPLGLPKGSVRATLTLVLSANFIVLQYYNISIAENFSVLIAISLTFYFGGRMRVTSTLTPKQTDDASLRAWGMPVGTIRVVLYVVFTALGVYVYLQNGDLPNYLQSIINLMYGHLLGSIWNSIKGKKANKRGKAIFGHLQAILAIVVVAFTYYITLVAPIAIALQDMWIDVASITLGFYFGERK